MHNSELIKKNYPQPNQSAYFNTSSTGLVSNSGVEKASQFNNNLLKYGSSFVEEFYLKEIPKIRTTISRFIDASLEEVALIPNFSYGLNALLPAVSHLRKILLYRQDYPSLIIPFELNDFQIYWIENKDGFHIDLDEIKHLVLKHQIEIVAISHIQYLTGFTIDIYELAEFCNSNNVLLIVDGTQSLGALNFSFKKSVVNIFISSNYKWMNSGFGSGIMCIDKQTQQKFTPRIGGYNSLKYTDHAWKYVPSINSYEPGHQNMTGLAMLHDAIEFKLNQGMQNIAEHNNKLIDVFTRKLSGLNLKMVGPMNNTYRSNIVGIYGQKALEHHLKNQKIIVKWRNDIIRVGMHFYNTEDDVNRLIQGLESYTQANTSS